MKKSLSVIVLVLFAVSAAAQDFEADLQENWDRIAGCFHSYEATPGPQTPAPGGYKPFYVSHYGRHGSRRQIGGGGTEAY